MTPQERQLVDELFDRLSGLESSPREADAEKAITDGLRRAPNASYALVQTVLVQDEALKRANARIQELEGDEATNRPPGGFLDSMRDALLGPAQSRGSVPTVSSGNGARRQVWNSGNVLGQNDQRQTGPAGGPSSNPIGGGGGGSFLGTAAAAAAGVIGGSMLMNSIRGLMGGGHQQSFGDTSSSAGANTNPWSGNSSDNLSRDAGINEIGKTGGNEQRQGFSDHASNDAGHSDDDNDGLDSNDFDGGGDSDYA